MGWCPQVTRLHRRKEASRVASLALFPATAARWPRWVKVLRALAPAAIENAAGDAAWDRTPFDGCLSSTSLALPPSKQIERTRVATGQL